MWATIRLIHPFPATLVVGTALLLLVLAHRGNPGLLLAVRAASVVVLSQIPVGALNEIVDVERDRVAQPNKPLPAGEVSMRAARAMVVFPLLALIPLALSFGITSLLLVTAGTAGGLAYDLWLKPTPASILGYLLGFLSLVTWIWLIAGRFTATFLLVYPAGTLALIAAHLAQSYPDIETDLSLGQRGLAAVLGPRLTLRSILVSYWIVTVMALALSLLTHNFAATVMSSVSTVLGLAALAVAPTSVASRHRRVTLFRLVAPGIALVAGACFTVLATLH